MLHRVKGIVIRATDYGEGNLIVTLLTPEYGKQGVVVRGARKPRSRYGALAQLFTYGDYAYYRTGTLGTLNSGEIVTSYRELREGLEPPAYAAYAAELTDRAIQDDEAAAYLFHQLLAFQSALAEGKDPGIVLRVYEMKVVAAAGYAPVLDECANCGSPEGPFRFSPPTGGALCPRCAHLDRMALQLDETVWKLLRLFAGLDLRRLGNIAVRPVFKRQLESALRRWMDTHLALNLKSRAFLDQLEKYGDLLGNADTGAAAAMKEAQAARRQAGAEADRKAEENAAADSGDPDVNGDSDGSGHSKANGDAAGSGHSEANGDAAGSGTIGGMDSGADNDTTNDADNDTTNDADNGTSGDTNKGTVNETDNGTDNGGG